MQAVRRQSFLDMKSKHRYAPDHSASTGGRQTRCFPMWGAKCPLSDIHFNNSFKFDNIVHGNKSLVMVFLLTAFVILLIAWPAKEDIPLHPGGRGEENGQGHTYRDEPGTPQQRREPHLQRGGKGQPAHEAAHRPVQPLQPHADVSGRRARLRGYLGV